MSAIGILHRSLSLYKPRRLPYSGSKAQCAIRAMATGNTAKKVENVKQVIEIFQELKTRKQIWSEKETDFPGMSPAPFPVGLGFRGLKDKTYELTPDAFREYSPIGEKSLFYDFQLNKCEHQKDHRSTFDWLTLMQHYETPTRLLDWSESILQALYFAVEPTAQANQNPPDGSIWILNAFRLNKMTSIFGDDAIGIGIPDLLNVTLRAEITISNNLTALFRKKSILECDEYDRPDENLREIFDRVLRGGDPTPTLSRNEFIQRIHSPFAVMPHKRTERIKLQRGFFTIFGGKASTEGDIEKFISLQEVNMKRHHSGKFIEELCYIPGASKEAIYQELRELGIHKASVYGDIVNFSKSLIEKWPRGKT